eukprot:CAMPEP_0174266922 /NCGR_PEP_ID=MMETSP0439-20130205/31905_1 /TAXON_ID=0 /ORGANISM="Stereomyxa ramosa, Strain Chinc5" /LENGTH=1204 /DNA_ID=CAMNT_0015354171 /DNA_START=38 /DNA_END=3652 /DNA_ORIENTATION=+
MQAQDNRPPANEPPKLLQRRDIDHPDDTETVWKNNYEELLKIINGFSEQEVNNVLQNKVSESVEKHSEVILGLLYGILVDKNLAPLYFRYLSFVQRDGFNLCVLQLQRVVTDKHQMFYDQPRKQLIWLIQELIKLRAPEVDLVVAALMRHMVGGDVTPKNINLIAMVLHLLMENKKWLYSIPQFIPIVLMAFLRLISDHNKPPLANLRKQEIAFCVSLLKEKFDDCRTIGRDLVRLLNDVRKIPELGAVWKDMMYNPSALSTTFTGVKEILSMKTSRRFLTSRLNPDMESKILFILKNVKMGYQKRYQTWFMQKYLMTPESESLICDLIRYICGVYHPPNHVLCSDIVPRWAIIGWLLRCVKTSYMAQSAKNALFYDWLFFNPKTDSIMNIEPAILLMMHSIPKYSKITSELIKFLVTAIDSYDEAHKDLIRHGIHNSLAVLLDKCVVTSLLPLYNCHAIEPAVRNKLQPIFSPWLGNDDKKKPLNQSQQQQEQLQHQQQQQMKQQQEAGKQFLRTTTEGPPKAKEHEDRRSSLSSSAESILLRKPIKPDSTNNIHEVPPALSHLGVFLVDFVQSLKCENHFEEQSNILRHLFSNLTKMSAISKYNGKVGVQLSIFLLNSLNFELNSTSQVSTLFSTQPKLHHTIFSTYLAKMMRQKNKRTQFGNTTSSSSILLDILYLLRSYEPSFGYRFLCWLLVHSITQQNTPNKDKEHKEVELGILGKMTRDNLPDGKRPLSKSREKKEKHYFVDISSGKHFSKLTDQCFYAYFEFLKYTHKQTLRHKTQEQKPPSNPLVDDLRAFAHSCVDGFMLIVPYVYRYFEDSFLNDFNSKISLLHLIVRYADPTHIQALNCKLTLGEFCIFGKQAYAFVEKALSWNSFEQFNVWGLLQAEFSCYPPSDVTELLSEVVVKIKAERDHSALIGIMSLAKHIQPTSLLLRSVLSFPSPLFVSSLLSHWTSNHPTGLVAEIKEEIYLLLKMSKLKEKNKRPPKDVFTKDIDKDYVLCFVKNLDAWLIEHRVSLVQNEEKTVLERASTKQCLGSLLKMWDIDPAQYSALALADELSTSTNSNPDDEEYQPEYDEDEDEDVDDDEEDDLQEGRQTRKSKSTQSPKGGPVRKRMKLRKRPREAATKRKRTDNSSDEEDDLEKRRLVTSLLFDDSSSDDEDLSNNDTNNKNSGGNDGDEFEDPLLHRKRKVRRITIDDNEES